VVATRYAPNVGAPFVSEPPQQPLVVRPRRPARSGGLVGTARTLDEPQADPLRTPPAGGRPPSPRRGVVVRPAWLYLGDTNRCVLFAAPVRTPRPRSRPGLAISPRLVSLTPAPARPPLSIPPAVRPWRSKARGGSVSIAPLLSLQPSGVPLPAKLVNPPRRPGRAVVLRPRWWPATPGVPGGGAAVLLPARALGRPRPRPVAKAVILPAGTGPYLAPVYPDPNASTSDQG
jgi:hypothetical protein